MNLNKSSYFEILKIKAKSLFTRKKVDTTKTPESIQKEIISEETK